MKPPGYLGRLILFCICITPCMLYAQVTISVQLPPGGMVQKEQLWNLIIVNTKDIIEVNIKLTLRDEQAGQVMMSANTGSLMLKKGVTILTNSSVQPVMYNYNGPGLQGNFLPMGSYVACYSLFYKQGDSEVPLGDECSRFNIDPLSPPLLNTPADKSNLQTPYPLFTWMPPTPLNMFSDLSYDIVVAETMTGQSPEEAVEYNTPIYTRNNLTRPNDNYSAAFAKLDTGKIYAWQVIAKNGFSYAAKTAVWSFTIATETRPVVKPANINYLLVENDLKGVYFITDKELHIKYVSFDKDHEASVIFSDADGKGIISVKKQIVQGDNYFDISLNTHFQKGVVYHVTLTDLGGKSQVLSFSIKSTDR